MDFSIRNTEPEMMDNPAVDELMLGAVLTDINRTNNLLRGNDITINALSALIKKHPKESYTILDMGCGDGNMLRKVVGWAKRHNISVRCIGIDLSAKGLALAREKSSNFLEIVYLKQDILALEPQDLKCDIVLCTLTMHHFHNEQIPQFLNQFVKLANMGIIINDLQRSRLAYYLFKIYSLMFVRTQIAKNDGLISIQSGFTKSELINFSNNLIAMSHTIKWRWAFRFLWVMEHKNNQHL